jgi:hypothetical protein
MRWTLSDGSPIVARFDPLQGMEEVEDGLMQARRLVLEAPQEKRPKPGAFGTGAPAPALRPLRFVHGVASSLRIS